MQASLATGTVDRRDFLRAVTFAKRAAKRDSKIPILSQLRIRSENGNGLRIAATNRDQLISVVVPATNEGEIDTTVGADTLAKALTGATDDLAVLSHDGNGGKLGIDFRPRPNRGSSALLTTLSAKDFPAIEFRVPVAFSIRAGQLLNALARVECAISKEETRYYLNGVYLSGWVSSENTKSLRFAATNGHVLADLWLHRFPLTDPFPRIIIPSAAVTDIMAMCRGLADSAPVKVSIGKTAIAVTSHDDGIYSKTIDGVYPDIDRVIRKDNPTTARMYLDDIRGTVALLEKASNKAHVGATFKFASDHCTVTLRNLDSGDTISTFPCMLAGSPLDIGLNVKLLSSIVRAIDSPEIVLGFDDSASPVNITDPTDDGARFVLMPMRV